MTETTLVLLKPDAVRRGLIGRIISRFEDKGLEIVAMSLRTLTQAQAARHYVDHIGKPFYEALIEFTISGPIVVMVLEGFDAFVVVRKMLGSADGASAALGTIRADFASGEPIRENLAHASDSPGTASREIAHFFPCLRPRCTCSYDESEEMTSHAPLCALNQIRMAPEDEYSQEVLEKLRQQPQAPDDDYYEDRPLKRVQCAHPGCDSELTADPTERWLATANRAGWYWLEDHRGERMWCPAHLPGAELIGEGED